MKVRHFFQQLDEAQVLAAIRNAEAETASEIHVFISHRKQEDIMAAAQKEFARLGMAKLPGRDGVLIYLAPREHKFAMIGGQAVHEKCGDAFWQKVTEEMSGHFRAGKFTDGVVHAIAKAGELLARHFPRQGAGVNRVVDEVSHD